MWSFVGRRVCTWWIWVAMIAGDRSDTTARCLWEAVPQEYRDGAIVYTGFLATLPGGDAGRASCRPPGKDSGLTIHVERQRCGRFVRETLSFSRCDSNHIGASWYFVRHYNESLL